MAAHPGNGIFGCRQQQDCVDAASGRRNQPSAHAVPTVGQPIVQELMPQMNPGQGNFNHHRNVETMRWKSDKRRKRRRCDRLPANGHRQGGKIAAITTPRAESRHLCISEATDLGHGRAQNSPHQLAFFVMCVPLLARVLCSAKPKRWRWKNTSTAATNAIGFLHLTKTQICTMMIDSMQRCVEQPWGRMRLVMRR